MKKIAVGILGATGLVGQKLVSLLANHPWFEVVALAASDRSSGKKYGEVVRGADPQFAEKQVLPCHPNLPCEVVFSALDSLVAKEVEEQFAENGYVVISNSSSHRMDPYVPLLIPEVNSQHIALLPFQPFNKGKILANPNCSVAAIALALKPLFDPFGIEALHVVTLQAISGAGNSLCALDIVDNVIPYIEKEEAKVEEEVLKILGSYESGKIHPPSFTISAQCMRVPVSHGHMACVSVKLQAKAEPQAIIKAWREWVGPSLPTVPSHPIRYFEENAFPQPRLHRDQEGGMIVSIGRLRTCPVLDWKFVVLSHNLIRGAAGAAIANAELWYQMQQSRDFNFVTCDIA